MLAGGALPAHQAARTCLAQAHAADPDEEPTTQGHDRAQALMAQCMETRGYVFAWNRPRCDRDYPSAIVQGSCYRRSRAEPGAGPSRARRATQTGPLAGGP